MLFQHERRRDSQNVRRWKITEGSFPKGGFCSVFNVPLGFHRSSGRRCVVDLDVPCVISFNNSNLFIKMLFGNCRSWMSVIVASGVWSHLLLL
jgi:hypothetical protein